MTQFIKKIELEFTILEFHEEYVISKAREGIVMGAQQVADLIEVCSGFYQGKDFVYLSCRVNEYNVNPTVFINLEQVKNLAGIGIVSNRESSLKMATFEKNFSKVPYEIFVDMEDALWWVRAMLQKKKAGL